MLLSVVIRRHPSPLAVRCLPVRYSDSISARSVFRSELTTRPCGIHPCLGQGRTGVSSSDLNAGDGAAHGSVPPARDVAAAGARNLVTGAGRVGAACSRGGRRPARRCTAGSAGKLTLARRGTRSQRALVGRGARPTVAAVRDARRSVCGAMLVATSRRDEPACRAPRRNPSPACVRFRPSSSPAGSLPLREAPNFVADFVAELADLTGQGDVEEYCDCHVESNQRKDVVRIHYFSFLSREWSFPNSRPRGEAVGM